jgi:ribonuclease HII
MDLALFVGVGRASAEEIDQYNILAATKLAMRRAAEGCPATRFFIDAVKDVGLLGEEIPVIKGDATSYSIAAASIVAKVSRDREMLRLHELYPQYAFDKNKGYGTAAHIAALKEYGPTSQHRQSFIGNFV